MISIIIRTKNEERWIGSCLRAVFSQTYKDFEVILIDNQSTDKTVNKARQFDLKILTIDNYLPGKAINLGVSESRGEIVVILSGHCIPIDNDWLRNLVNDLGDHAVAGVYGRQQPMSFSSDNDKRDLLTVFGPDKKIQIKDSFFHNANSAIRKEFLEKFPFDDTATNIEDRIWGKQVVEQGFKIVYEPAASVYHHHGIHQDHNAERCKNVVRILESLNGTDSNGGELASKLDLSELQITVLIPIVGELQDCGGRQLLEYTIDATKESHFIKDVIVLTDNNDIAGIARNNGAIVPFLRPENLSESFIGIRQVLQYSLERLEKLSYLPDIVMVLEITYPFRPKRLLDDLLEQFVREGKDCLIPVKVERRSAWVKQENRIEVVSRFMPRNLKEELLYISLFGLGFVVYPELIRNGDLIGEKVSMFEVDDYLSAIEVRDEKSLQFADSQIEKYWQQRSYLQP